VRVVTAQPFVIGVAAALATCAYGRAMRMDRDRAFYPVMLIVVASYYALFAAMAGRPSTIAIEAAIGVAFAVAASIGYRRSPWIVAVALAAHGLQDAVHGQFIENPGVPAWWPAWCLAFDVTAGAWLAWMLARRPSIPAHP
jgi:hypothetical protein